MLEDHDDPSYLQVTCTTKPGVFERAGLIVADQVPSELKIGPVIVYVLVTSIPFSVIVMDNW